MNDQQLIANFIGCYPIDHNGTPLVFLKKHDQLGVVKGHICRIMTILVAESNDKGIVPLKKRHSYGISEDNTYKLYPELHRSVPRCYSYLQVIDSNTQHVKLEKRMHGFYKFSSNDVNNEDEDIACNLIDPEQQKQADTVIVTEKANGKAAIFSSFEFDGNYFLFGGSKTKHRVVRLENAIKDIDNSERDENSRNLLMKDIFAVFIDQYNSLQNDQLRSDFIKLLESKSLCGEFNDYKHIVSNRSDSLKLSIKWFGFSENQGTINRQEGLNGDLFVFFETMGKYGLPLVTYKIYTVDEYETIKDSLKLGADFEGWVVHWIKSLESGSHKTVGVEKLKTWWYIVVRMLREIIRGTKDLKNDYELKVKKTLLKRNTDFMKLPDGMLLLWSNLCCEFCKWFIEKNYKFIAIDFQDDSIGMGNIWRQFMIENAHLNDNFDLPEKEMTKQGLTNYKFKLEIKQTQRLVVIFKGLPGLGKSHIGNLVRMELNKLGLNVVSLEQDDFTGKSAGQKCLAKFTDYVKNQSINVILLQRNNANRNQYGRYVDVADYHGVKVIFVSPAEIDLKILLLVCIEAVIQRHGHKTFDQLSEAVRAKLVLSFYLEFRKEENDHALQWLSVANDQDVDISVSNYLIDYLNELQQSKNVYDNRKYRPLMELNEKLRLKTTNYQQYRRSTNDLVTELKSLIIGHLQ